MQKYASVAFKVGYWIDGFKTWVILNKLKISDLKLKKLLGEGKDDDDMDTADETDLFENIKEGLKRFESEVLEKSNYWQVGYQWVKALGEMMTTDLIIFNEKVLKKVKEDANITEASVNLNTLEKLGWLNKVAEGTYILNGSYPGKIKTLTLEKNEEVKKAITNLRMKAVSNDLQNFLYFGGEGFNGFRHWTTFGEDKEDSWLFKLEDVGQSVLLSIQEGKNIEKEIFHDKNESALHKTNRHIDIIFDASISHIEEDLNRKFSDLEADVGERNFDLLQEEIFRLVTITQRELTEITNEGQMQENFNERNKIFKDLISKATLVIKQTSDKLATSDKKMDFIVDLKETLYLAYKSQEDYINEAMDLYSKLSNITTENELTNMIANLSITKENPVNKAEKAIASQFNKIVTCIEEDPYT